jgi:hypothetical protein
MKDADNILNDARLTAADRKRATADDRSAPKGTMEDRIAKARANFSAQWNQSSLPSIDDDPDWHYCWLSTTNTYDPIQQRMNLGYEPVRPEDIKGRVNFSGVSIQSGDFAGCVSTKEMVLFRIPKEIYQVAMEEMHHYEPIRQEAALKEQYDQLASGRDSGGRSLGRDIGDGVNALGQAPVKVPLFA